MKLYDFNIEYNENKKSSYRVLLDDGNKTLTVILELYLINKKWYIDIKTNEDNLHIGQKINSYVDLFKTCKYRYKDFPEVELKAIPINLHGFDVEFNDKTAGILQDLRIIIDNEDDDE